MTRMQSFRIAASSSTSASGGRPPALSPMDIAPRVGWKRSPISRAASIVSSSRAPFGIEVEVIRGHRAARQRQLRQPDQRRDAHLLRPEPRPDRIERLQPAEEQRVLPAGHGAGQRLVEMVMGVDEARRDDAALRLDDRARGAQSLPDLGDHAAPDQDVTARDLGAVGSIVTTRRRLGRGSRPSVPPRPFGMAEPAGDRRGKDSPGSGQSRRAPRAAPVAGPEDSPRPANGSGVQDLHRCAVELRIRGREHPPALVHGAPLPVGDDAARRLDHRDRAPARRRPAARPRSRGRSDRPRSAHRRSSRCRSASASPAPAAGWKARALRFACRPRGRW